MAALPNVVCKLSGVTTEADHKTWTRDQLRPYIDHVIECFGPDRILYGGDWPVSELAGELSAMARDARLGDGRLFAGRQAQALPRQRDQGLSARRLMDKATLERKGYSVAALRDARPQGAAAHAVRHGRRRRRRRDHHAQQRSGAGRDRARSDAARRRADARPVGRAVRREAALARHHRPDRLRRACCGRTPNSRRRAPRRGSGRSIRRATPRPSSLEEIGAATPGPKWMQTFLYKDRGLTEEFAARAAAAGYKALILTVDNQVVAGRDRDARNGTFFPLRWGPRRVVDSREPSRLAHAHARDALAELRQLRRALLDRPPSARSCSSSSIRTSAGATSTGCAACGAGRSSSRASCIRTKRARRSKRGADGIIVSNHGGRQLDGAVASIRALPGIVEAVGGRAPVLVDGGFRRGVDVVKALALGARAVLIGRPHLWGVACAGEDGVFWVLELFRREIDRALALGGWDGMAKLDRSIFFDSRPDEEPRSASGESGGRAQVYACELSQWLNTSFAQLFRVVAFQVARNMRRAKAKDRGGDWPVSFQASTRRKSAESKRKLSRTETNGFATGRKPLRSLGAKPDDFAILVVFNRLGSFLFRALAARLDAVTRHPRKRNPTQALPQPWIPARGNDNTAGCTSICTRPCWGLDIRPNL